MTERRSIARKNTPREKPQGVFSVQYYLVVAHVAVAAGTAPVVAAAGTAPVVVAPVVAAAGTAPVVVAASAEPPAPAARHVSRYERLPQANRAGRCCP